MCERQLNQHAPFVDFIRCWCHHTQNLDPGIRRQRAYYWAWQHANWFETLVYLTPSTVLSTQPWWTWDPTPRSAEEASVDDATWRSDLDPAQTPWLHYADVCFQMHAGEDHTQQLQEALASILGFVDQPVSQRELEELKQECVICSNELGSALLFNLLHDDFQKWGADSPAAYTRARLNAEGRPLTSTFELLRDWQRQTQLPLEIVVRVSEAFFAEPTLEAGLALVLPCSHAYHDKCAHEWSVMQETMHKDALGQVGGLFAPLKMPHDSAAVIRTKRFSCPTCRKPATSATVPPLGVLPLQGVEGYKTTPTVNTDAEWGPYRLRKDALVWVYNVNAWPGGPYTGSLALLRSVDTSSAPPKFVVETFPLGYRWTVPMAAVFDVSFFELNMLPTRHELSTLMAQPFGTLLGGYFQNTPAFFTEPIGFEDYTRARGLDPRETDTRAEYVKLIQAMADVDFDRTLATRLERHRAQTESPMLAGVSVPRMDASALVAKMLDAMGWYQLPNPVNINFPNFIGNDFVEFARKHQQQNTAWAQSNVHVMELARFIAYARSGYDLLPDHSAALLPEARLYWTHIPATLRPLVLDPRRTPLPRRGHGAAASAPPRPKPRPRKRPAASGSAAASGAGAEEKAPPAAAAAPKPPRKRSKPGAIYARNVEALMQAVEPITGPRARGEVELALSTLETFVNSESIQLRRKRVQALPREVYADLLGRLVTLLL